MKLPAWSMRKIIDRCNYAAGVEPPTGGDILRFQPSGRLYQVMRRRGRTQHCMVLPDDFDVTKEPPGTRVFDVHWVSNGRRRA